MCFSNLPVAFDDEGNPYLAEEAEDVDPPGNIDARGDVDTSADADGSTSGGDRACGCSAEPGEVALDEGDPEATYEAIVASMPGDVGEEVAETEDPPEETGCDRRESTKRDGRGSAERDQQSAQGD
jgi:hypothetical protein